MRMRLTGLDKVAQQIACKYLDFHNVLKKTNKLKGVLAQTQNLSSSQVSNLILHRLSEPDFKINGFLIDVNFDAEAEWLPKLAQIDFDIVSLQGCSS